MSEVGQSTSASTRLAARTSRLMPPWQKGQSGNPGGQNLRVYHQVRKFAAEHSMEAAQRLVSLMREDDERVAYMAATAILDRGVGKPRDHSDEESALGRIDLSALSQSDQALLIELLKRVMGMAQPK